MLTIASFHHHDRAALGAALDEDALVLGPPVQGHLLEMQPQLWFQLNLGMVLLVAEVECFGLFLLDNLFDLPILLAKVLHVDFGCLSKRVVALHFPERLLPVTHLGALVVLAHDVLQVVTVLCLNYDVAELLLRLDPVPLVDYPDVDVNLQVDVDRVLWDREELLSLGQVTLLWVRCRGCLESACVAFACVLLGFELCLKLIYIVLI